MSCKEVLKIVPLTLRQANDVVASLHRHHKPVQGHRWSIGVENSSGTLVGAAIVGRPVARMIDQDRTVEVTRLVTDGTCNAPSALYGAVRRIAQHMGFDRVITYILESEPGTSLKAVGWKESDIKSTGGTWNRPSRGRIDKAPIVPKKRYEACLRGCI